MDTYTKVKKDFDNWRECYYIIKAGEDISKVFAIECIKYNNIYNNIINNILNTTEKYVIHKRLSNIAYIEIVEGLNRRHSIKHCRNIYRRALIKIAENLDAEKKLAAEKKPVIYRQQASAFYGQKKGSNQ